MKRTLFIIHLMLCCHLLFSQSDWVNYQISNTMFPSNPYKHITIDSNGNKWIATQNNGLLRFDGTNWEVFNTTNTPALTSNMINHVFFDSEENLWVSTLSGGLLKKTPAGVWSVYNTNIENFPSNDINWVTEGNKKEIYAATRNGLAIINADNSIRLVANSTFSAMPSNEITTVAIHYPENDTLPTNIWIGTSNGLVQMVEKDGQVPTLTVYNTGNSPLTGNGITGIMIDRFFDIWVSIYNWHTNAGGGVARISSSDLIIKTEDWTVFDNHLSSNNVRSMAYENINDSQLSHWFTTDNGISRFNGIIWEFFNTGNSINLPTNNTYGIAIEGSLKWFGTNYNMVRFDGVTWSNFDYLSAGIPNNHIQTMTFDPLEPTVKWIGTANGMTRFNGSNWRVFNISNSSLPTNDIRTLAIDRSGFLWIGTAQFNNLGGGLVRQNVSNNSMQVYKTENSPLPWNTITKIAICSQDKKWIGTMGGGLISFRHLEEGIEEWSTFNKTTHGLPSDNIHDIFVSSDDFKWVSTDAGIALLHNTNNLVIREYNINNSNLPSNNIRRIKQDREGYIWAVTGNGLSKLVDDNWIMFTTTGLQNNTIMDIDFDVQNIKWITTQQGLFRTNEHDWSVLNPSNSDLISTNLNLIIIEDIENNGSIVSHKWVGSRDAGLSLYRGGHQQFANGSYINVFQHPLISNSLKITAVVNNFRVDEVRFQINNITTPHTEIAYNTWMTEHIFETSQNARIAFRFTHAEGDSTLIRNLNVSMLSNSNLPIHITDGIYVELIESLPQPEWLVSYIDDSEKQINFREINSSLENNLMLLTPDGYKLQRKPNEGNDWIDVSTSGSKTFIESFTDYRFVKTTVQPLNTIHGLVNYPNPFNPETTISFTLTESSDNVNIEIYDIRGRKIKNLYKGALNEGLNNIVWNGNDELNNNVASGVYFIRVKTNHESIERKILLLK